LYRADKSVTLFDHASKKQLRVLVPQRIVMITDG
jgi:hypothetical protein